MRKQLSMKRIHMLSANYIISLAKRKGIFDEKDAQYAQTVVYPVITDFIKYIWEHKEDDGLYSLSKPEEAIADLKKNENI